MHEQSISAILNCGLHMASVHYGPIKIFLSPYHDIKLMEGQSRFLSCHICNKVKSLVRLLIVT